MNIISSFLKNTQPENSESPLPENMLEFIANYVAKGLKPHGFTRNGPTLYRQNGDLLQIVNVQGGKWNEKHTGEVYLNLSIFHPKVYEIEWGSPAPKFPKEYEAPMRMRIENHNHTLPREWKYDISTNADDVAHEIVTTIINHGLPLLDQFATLADLARALPDTKKNGMKSIHTLVDQSVVAFLMDDLEQARTYMQQYMKKNTFLKKNDPMDLSIKRDQQQMAQAMGFSLDLPELEGESCVAFYIPLKGSVPINDERRTVNKLLLFLYNLEKKKLGYINYHGRRCKAQTERINFFTRDPKMVVDYINERQEKFKIPVEVIREE